MHSYIKKASSDKIIIITIILSIIIIMVVVMMMCQRSLDHQLLLLSGTWAARQKHALGAITIQ